jgi:hypothetical protein
VLWFSSLLAACVSRAPTAYGWGGQHNEASTLAAAMSPEPFRSHAADCRFACYPDAMQDHAVGHSQDGYTLRLFTREAIAALRADDVPKALFFASAATHYLTDRVCVAHATRAWYHQAADKDPWTCFLPRKYLSTAANTVVQPSLDACLPGWDKLMVLAEHRPVVAIAAEAPWPVQRAAHVVALELLRAEHRLAKAQGRPAPTRPVADYVVQLAAETGLKPLQGHSAIVLLTPADEPLAKTLRAPTVPRGAAGLIAARRPGDSAGPVTVVLHGTSRQDSLYLVDYLLDLAWAPRQGPWPAQRAVEVLQSVWSGWRLIVDLRGMQGAAAVAYARKLPYSHVATRKEDAAKYAAGMRQGLQPGADAVQWWQHFLLELPLPDGRRVSTMLDRGTDYSTLLPLVAR